jgi:hypothetical protein
MSGTTGTGTSGTGTLTFFVASGNLENSSSSTTYATVPTLTDVDMLYTGVDTTSNGVAGQGAGTFLIGGSSTTLDFGSGSTGGTVSFAGNGDKLGDSGVYDGYTGDSWAPAADSSGLYGVTTNYYDALSSDNVRFSFNSPQTFFGLLWGSINNTNTITFYSGANGTGSVIATLYGYQLETALDPSSPATSKTTNAVEQSTYYVGMNLSQQYSSVVMSNSGGGFEFAEVSYSSTAVTTVAQLTDGSTPAATIDVKQSNGSSLPGTSYCFLAGTMIATPAGERAVEMLKAGDMVTTASGAAAAVTWLGRQTISSAFADKTRVLPIRVKADALAAGVPARDLLVSPDHALLVDGVLVHASALVNGISITRETRMPATFVYYHVETANHELILAEGAAAETFIDNADRLAFDNWNEHPGNDTLVEMDLPRVKSARQLPRTIKARLEARAAEMFGVNRTVAA